MNPPYPYFWMEHVDEGLAAFMSVIIIGFFLVGGIYTLIDYLRNGKKK